MKLFNAIIASALLSLGVCGTAAAGDWVKADSVMNASISEGIIPGAVAAMLENGKITYQKAYGNMQLIPVKEEMADLSVPVPMREDAIFDMASVTKVVVTTTAVMQLWENGLIDVGAPVGKYLKEFDGQDVTVTDLLTHTSGIRWSWKVYSRNNGGREAVTGVDGIEKLILYLADSTYRKPRNTMFSYSCANFFLLQQIVERLTGERLCDYAQKNIFDRLGMKDSHFFIAGEEIPSEILNRVAPGRVTLPKGRVDDTFARTLLKGNGGNAGLYSTVSDLALFCTAIMNGGKNDNGRILKASTIRKMSKVVDPRFGRALGWDVHASSKSWLKGYSLSKDSIVHGGHTGTMLAIDLKNKRAIIILANRSHPYNGYYDEWKDKRVMISTYLASR